MNAAYFDQFNINRLIHFQIRKNRITIRNLIITLTISLITLKILLKQNKIIPNQLELLIEIIHNSIKNICTEHLNKNNNIYFPLILSFFILITCINLTGILPYVFTLTSHIRITLTLSFRILLTATLTGFKKWNTKFLSILTPQSAPLILTPFLILIETIRYITRIISLRIRLTANISAGHLLFTILSRFITETINNNLYLISIIPITVLTFIIILEIMVAIIQAYVFTLLTTIYLSDAIKLH
uniref:ATP synthase subunit a n=1 Tax=Lophophysema eversa TaxID=1510205 RepID=A0A068LC49_9METZ|nr:ATP synthase F0 subunit 6 [Lophophysema eversa]